MVSPGHPYSMRTPPSTVTRRFTQDYRSLMNRSILCARPYLRKKIRTPDLSRVWYHRSDLTTQVPHGLTWSSLLHEDTAVDGDAQVLAGSPQSQEQKYSMRASLSPQKNKDAGFVDGLVSP